MSLSNSRHLVCPSLRGVGVQFDSCISPASVTMFHGGGGSSLHTVAGEDDLDSYLSQFHQPPIADHPHPEYAADGNDLEEGTGSLYDEQDSDADYDDCSTCTNEEDIVLSDVTNESFGNEFDLIVLEDVDTRLKSSGNLSIKDPSTFEGLKLQ